MTSAICRNRHHGQGPAFACLPNDSDMHLLLAACGPLEQAGAAWHQWRSQNMNKKLDDVSHRLLPLVFRRLHEDQLTREDRTFLRGLYRYHWTRNQLLSRAASSVLRTLQSEGIDTLVLKGLALAHLTYRDLGVRPMQDFDVLVRPRQRDLAATVLERSGWCASQTIPSLSAAHGCEFANQGGQRFDLHWYATDESRWTGADDDLWHGSSSFRIESAETRTLNPTHRLLHVLIHGVKVTGSSPLAWVSDALKIIEAHPDLDWSGFLDSVRIRRVVLPVELGLSYLRDKMNCPVPNCVMVALSETPVQWTDRFYYASKVRGGHHWLALTQPYLDYLRTAQPTCGGNLFEFIRFLMERWQLQTIWQLPGRIWRGFARRLPAKLSNP